jgi:hypothetical protein
VDMCMTECGNNVCMGMQPDGPCQACVQTNCGTQIAECLQN